MAENIQDPGSGLQLKSVVLATDFLESSRLALDYAVAFAHQFAATLTIVHIFEMSFEAVEAEIVSHRPSVTRAAALARLEAFAAGVHRAGIQAQVDLRDGEPCAAILNAAAERHCDLLVLGTHGIYRGLQHLVLGSNAEKIMLSTPCPALTVGRHVMAGIDLDLKIGNIVFISDLTQESIPQASYALRLGQRLGIPVDLAHIRSGDPSADAELSGKLAARYGEILTKDPLSADPQWNSAKYHLERLLDPQELMQRAEASANSLFVTCVYPASRASRHLHASIAFELAARAASPLLSIPWGKV